MKKLIFRTLLLVGLISLNSCEENTNPQFDNVNGQTMIRFASTSATMPVEPTGVTSQDLVVHVTTVSTSDRTISLEVDAASTATSSQYTINDIVIPAGEYVGTGSIIGNYASLPAVGSVELIMNMTAISGGASVQENATFTLTLERFCPLVIADFYGTFTQLGGYNGAAPSARGDATISAGPVAGTLLISDLYASGRSAVIELDFSDTANPKVIHRSEEFDAVFAVYSLGSTYTEDILQVHDNSFNTCTKIIKLSFNRRIAQPDGRYYGGTYEIILTKN